MSSTDRGFINPDRINSLTRNLLQKPERTRSMQKPDRNDEEFSEKNLVLQQPPSDIKKLEQNSWKNSYSRLESSPPKKNSSINSLGFFTQNTQNSAINANNEKDSKEDRKLRHRDTVKMQNQYIGQNPKFLTVPNKGEEIKQYSVKEKRKGFSKSRAQSSERVTSFRNTRNKNEVFYKHIAMNERFLMFYNEPLIAYCIKKKIDISHPSKIILQSGSTEIQNNQKYQNIIQDAGKEYQELKIRKQNALREAEEIQKRKNQLIKKIDLRRSLKNSTVNSPEKNQKKLRDAKHINKKDKMGGNSSYQIIESHFNNKISTIEKSEYDIKRELEDQKEIISSLTETINSAYKDLKERELQLKLTQEQMSELSVSLQKKQEQIDQEKNETIQALNIKIKKHQLKMVNYKQNQVMIKELNKKVKELEAQLQKKDMEIEKFQNESGQEKNKIFLVAQSEAMASQFQILTEKNNQLEKQLDFYSRHKRVLNDTIKALNTRNHILQDAAKELLQIVKNDIIKNQSLTNEKSQTDPIFIKMKKMEGILLAQNI